MDKVKWSTLTSFINDGEILEFEKEADDEACEVWEKATRQKAAKGQPAKGQAATLDGGLEKIVKRLGGGGLMECGQKKLDFSKMDGMASDNKEEGEGDKVDDE